MVKLLLQFRHTITVITMISSNLSLPWQVWQMQTAVLQTMVRVVTHVHSRLSPIIQASPIIITVRGAEAELAMAVTRWQRILFNKRIRCSNSSLLRYNPILTLTDLFNSKSHLMRVVLSRPSLTIQVSQVRPASRTPALTTT